MYKIEQMWALTIKTVANRYIAIANIIRLDFTLEMLKPSFQVKA